MSDNDGLERAASEYIQRLPFAGTLGEYDNAVRKLVALLAAQRMDSHEAQAKRILQLEEELESHVWEYSPAMAFAQIEQQAEKIEALHNQVTRWKAEAQLAATRYLLSSAGEPASHTDYARAVRIRDGVL